MTGSCGAIGCIGSSPRYPPEAEGCSPWLLSLLGAPSSSAVGLRSPPVPSACSSASNKKIQYLRTTAAQSAARHDHPHTTPTRRDGTGGQHGVAALELGAAPEGVFALEMATCPWCRRGALRLIAVTTQESVITCILRHLQLASVPPPIAPARARQEIYAFA
jgi:hypothetical protein